MLISRKLYENEFKSGIAAKSLTLLVLVKNTYRNGSFMRYSLSLLARRAGISRTAARKYIAWLIDKGYASVENAGSYCNLRFGKIREKARSLCIDLSPFSQFTLIDDQKAAKSRFRDLYSLLLGISIAQTQGRKIHCKDIIEVSRNPFSERERKSAQRKLKRIKDGAKQGFCDNGISYDYIKRALGASAYMVSKVIKACHGRLFSKVRRVVALNPLKYHPCGVNMLNELKNTCVSGILDKKNSIGAGFFYSFNGVVYNIKSNLYVLTEKSTVNPIS